MSTTRTALPRSPRLRQLLRRFDRWTMEAFAPMDRHVAEAHLRTPRV